MAFVYDPNDVFRHAVNPESVVTWRVGSRHREETLHALVEEHARETG